MPKHKVTANPVPVSAPTPVTQASIQQQMKTKLWQNARQVLRDEFVADPKPGGMRHAFLCNIAMMLYDKYGLDHSIANCAADDVIKLAFEDTYY